MAGIIHRRIKRNSRVHLRRVLMLAAGFFCIFYFIFSFGKLHYINYIEGRRLAEVKQEKRQWIQKRDSLLEEKKNFLNIDYLKGYARKKLFLMEPREVPIRVINPSHKDGEPADAGNKNAAHPER